MLKKDVFDYINKGDGERSGAATLLAEILKISSASISKWGETIPETQADKLDKFLRDRDNLKKYGLRVNGRPVFSKQKYREHQWNVRRRRELGQLKKLKAKYEV